MTSSRGPRAGASRCSSDCRGDFDLEAGYVGSKSDHLLNDGMQNINYVPSGR